MIITQGAGLEDGGAWEMEVEGNGVASEKGRGYF